jgi:nucleoside-triphosphatase THEP1
MNGSPTSGGNALIYYRLIALWVLCEAMLGGIIHGLKIPVSGLIVGSCAVICICLIAWYVPVKGAIIRATVIVAIFKMMLSPQAPPPAYIAVFFQGLLGELLFWKRRFFTLCCLVLAVLSLLESGLQRILVLTILYGNDLWKVVNNFINGLTGQRQASNYSLIIGSVYVALHVVAGVLAGWWASVLPARVSKWGKQDKYHFVSDEPLPSIPVVVKRKGKKGRLLLLIIWIALVVLYVQSNYRIGTPLLPPHMSLRILVRSLIIILAWVFLIGPLLKRLLHVWLQKRKTKSQPDIQKVLELLPATQQLVAQSWRASAGVGKWARLVTTGKTILVNALQPPGNKRVIILSRTIQTGKTTSLVNWSEGRKDVTGILTPVVNGKRVFMDAHTREQFGMEASEMDVDVLSVGRFVFSKASFERAQRVIRGGVGQRGVLVIDEVGPLEMRGEGFHNVVKEVLQRQDAEQTIILVVREGLVDRVREFFMLSDVVVVRDVEEFKGLMV